MTDVVAIGPREILEEQAEGKIKEIYADIKETLHVPIVNLVFRVLATYADFLQVAWQSLKPNAQTVFFERQGDEIRRYATEVMASLGQPPPASGDIAQVLRVFHYVNPKLLLAVAALRSATEGLQPKLQELSREEKQRIPPEVPPEARPIEMVEPEAASEQVKGIFDDIKETLGIPVVNSDYRALACWSDYLAEAWQALKPIVSRPEYGRLQRDLGVMAEKAVIVLPYRMDLSPHVLRLIGLSEQEQDQIRDLLNTFSALLPGLIANIGFLTIGAEGRERALQSSFPPVIH